MIFLPKNFVFHDKYLLLSVIALVMIGAIMITSASMAISERQYHTPFHYLLRHSSYLFLGLIAATITIQIPLKVWLKASPMLLGLGILFLILVLIPGIGKQVNGSARWIGIGALTLQVSEWVKLASIVFLAHYFAQNLRAIRGNLSELFKPLALLAGIAILLLLEPDFGATAVIMLTALMMLYLAGTRLWPFGILLIVILAGLGILAIASPYRLVRLTAFLDPWNNQFKSGYQLTQSLIAFGRGGIFGVGLGSSIQKLFYLPEGHTDFLFAVLGEELGLVGILTVIGLYVTMTFRSFLIGKRATLAGQTEAGYIAFGIATWLGFQALINMGVNAGLLPTKGLTLPFISYGGSSLVIVLMAIAILFRIDHETYTSSAR